MSHHYIEFKNVSYTYPGSGIKALDNVSLRITHGQKVALLGRNGAGKSTLLLLTDGLLRADSGTVDVGGIPVTRKTLDLIRQSVGLVFQNPDDMLFMPTVEEDVAFGPMNMRLPKEAVDRHVTEALKVMGVEDLRLRASSTLSGGQKRRVAIASVLSMEPSVLVLDEPTSNMDWDARGALIGMLKEFMHTCLIATHDLGMVRELCDRVIVLDHGRICADTTPAQMLRDRGLKEMLGLRPDTVEFSF